MRKIERCTTSKACTPLTTCPLHTLPTHGQFNGNLFPIETACVWDTIKNLINKIIELFFLQFHANEH